MRFAEHPWDAPPPPLGHADDVHVWAAPLDLSRSLLDRLATDLSPDERARADRFRFEQLRARYLAGRALLRMMLARYVHRPAASLRFAYGAHGKPALAMSDADAVPRFNLAHAGGLALIAISSAHEVGVDVEELRALPDAMQVAQRHFSAAECRTLRALPEDARDASFLRCWTRKEAYIKAVGEGLSCPLDSFDVTLAPDEPARILEVRRDPDEASRWTLVHLSPAPGWIGAVALRTPSVRLRCLRLVPPDAPSAGTD
jgi:4'-phosphopantetheinyl transferase